MEWKKHRPKISNTRIMAIVTLAYATMTFMSNSDVSSSMFSLLSADQKKQFSSSISLWNLSTLWDYDSVFWFCNGCYEFDRPSRENVISFVLST